jgi:hypothetical protein
MFIDGSRSKGYAAGALAEKKTERASRRQHPLGAEVSAVTAQGSYKRIDGHA